MGNQSIVEHIPNLTTAAANLAKRMDQQPKNRYGIPLYHLQPRERPEVESTQRFLRTANQHLMQLIHEAEAAHTRGHLVELEEINDPWEQKALMLKLGRMRSKGNSVTRYPWDPADVLYLDSLIEVLKEIILEGDSLRDDVNGEGSPDQQQERKPEDRMDYLEANIVAILNKLGMRPVST